MEQRLLGKTAIVTGAGQGIGKGVATRLAREGARVVIADYNAKTASAAAQEIAQSTGSATLAYPMDISDVTAGQGLVDATVAKFGRIDILVNNAGGNLRHENSDDSASGASLERLQFIMDINLNSAIYCCQAASRPMKEQKAGKIVNISSQAGLWSGRDGGGMPYKIAKAGVAHYTRVLAAELGPYGINVNCIAPGFIASARTVRNWDKAGNTLTDQIALRRVGQPEEAAKVIEFLVTDLSDYVTGQCLPVCGGYVAW